MEETFESIDMKGIRLLRNSGINQQYENNLIISYTGLKNTKNNTTNKKLHLLTNAIFHFLLCLAFVFHSTINSQQL